MTTYVAMLRGINVGGRQRVSMSSLKALVTGLGHHDVETYIQSGNVVFRSPDAVAETVARRIEEQIARELGLTVSVLVRTAAELKRIRATNPFLKSGKDPASLYVIFLSVAPDRTRLAMLDFNEFAPDEFRVAGREIFGHGEYAIRIHEHRNLAFVHTSQQR